MKKEKKESALRLLGEGTPIPKIAKLLKVSRVAVWKWAQEYEGSGLLIRTCKKPAIYRSLLPTDRKVNDSLLGSSLVNKDHRNLIHSTHRLKFSIEYQGEQPFRGATEVKPFGRYGTARQSVFKLGRITIVAFKHKLNVWVHRPAGKLIRNQIINARRDAYLSLLNFAETHRIAIKGDLSQVLRSHHVVEHKQVNKDLKPIFEAYGDEIEKRTGSNICKSSHPDKIEHKGVSAEITGARVGENSEYLFTRFPNDFSTVVKSLEGFEEYNRNIKLHLGVLREMAITLKKIQKAL